MSKPIVFQKPIEVSEELSNFLGLPDGELIARTEVTSKINDYCKRHNLKDSNDKRVIIPNETLKKLLRLKKDDKVTFFNLQKHLKHHYAHHYPSNDGVFSNIVRFQSRPSTTMIKVWSEEEKRWMPSYYYFKPGILPRTVGYMCQKDIDGLPTRADVIKNIYRAKL